MTTRFRSSRGGFRARLRTRYTWRPFQRRNTTVIDETKDVWSLDVTGPGSFLSTLGVVGDYTIRRIRATLMLRNLNAVAGAPTVVYWGVQVVTRDAFDAVPPVSSNPETDGADWLLYGTAFAPANGNGLVNSIHEVIQIELDSKAMRKVNENSQRVIFVMENPISSAPDIQYACSGRLLVSHGKQ